MISLQIADTDAFLDMPATSQLLYFHLTIRADDEGFVNNPKKISRLIGTQDDDLKVLVAKRFVLSFESGVVVIKHWLIHNTIRMDRFNKTVYQDEKNSLVIKENRSYTEMATNRQPNDNQLATQVKLSKDKLSQVKLNKVKKSKVNLQTEVCGKDINSLIEKFKPINPSYEILFKNTTQRKVLERMVKKYTYEKVVGMIEVLPEIVCQKYAPQISTPIQLENKLGQLLIFIKQNKKKKGEIVL